MLRGPDTGQGGAARIAAKTGNSGLLPNSGAILPVRRFSPTRKSHLSPVEKNGVWQGARGLVSRAVLF